MKKFEVLFAISLTMATMACNNPSQTGSGSSSSGGNSSQEAAGNIIGYTNAVVDMVNQQSDYQEQLLKTMDETVKELQHPDDRMRFVTMTHPTKTTTFSMHKVDVTVPTDALNKADQAYFKGHVLAYQSINNRIDSFDHKLTDYLTAENFKDDKSVLGFTLADSIRANVNRAFTEKNALMDKISGLAADAEAVILKDSPLRDYILNMKKDMKSVKAFVLLYENTDNHYAASSDSINTAYAALETAQADHAQTNISNALKAGKNQDYDYFYRDLKDFLLQAKKITRDAAAAGKANENDAEALERYYDSLIKDYNRFNS